MLQRTLPAGFIAPCLPIKTDRLPSSREWLHEIKHDGFRMLVRHDPAGVRLFTRRGRNLLLTSVAALLIATSAAYTRELSKSQSWKLIQGTWCVGDHPADDEAYV
jgi:ATP-dependent DNA ligase